MKENSAADIWMHKSDREEMYNMAKKGFKFKSVIYDNEDAEPAKIDTLKSKGWEVFIDEDNMSSTEVILYKK